MEHLGPDLLVRCDTIKISPNTETLNSAIARALLGDVIMVDPGVYSGYQNCNITVTVSFLEIRGDSENTIFDCSGTGLRHLTIAGDDCTINGIKFRNGVSTGAQYLGNKSSARDGVFTYLPDENILSTSALQSTRLDPTNTGGCVLITGSRTVLKNSAFVNCTSSWNGGAISVQSAGGTTILKNLFISGAQSGARGGALLVVSSQINMSDSAILNSAAVEGGGVYMVGGLGAPASLLGSNLTLRGNSASSRSAQAGSTDWSGSGGAVVADGPGTVLVLSGRSVLQNNTALWLGGAILGRAGANVTIAGQTLLTSNSALLGGGAVAVLGAATSLLVCERARLSSNAALGASGDLSGRLPGSDASYGPLALTLPGLGGAVLAGAGALAAFVDAALVDNNTASLGGAAYATSMNPVLRAMGRMSSALDPARILVSGTAVMAQNQARGRPGAALGCGGAVYGAGGVSISAAGAAELNLNSADDFGGGIMVEAGGTCDLRAGWDGALAPTLLAAATSVSDRASLSDNSARAGGGIYSSSGAVTLAGAAVLQRNSAQTDGGGVLVSAGPLRASGAWRCLRNTAAGGNGGCAYSSGMGVALSGRVAVSQCSAVSGGGLYVTGQSLNVSGDVSFAGNSASREGGGIYGSNVTASLTDRVVFLSNSATAATATASGGAVFFSSSMVGMSGRINFTSNSASSFGGAVCVAATALNCSGSVVFQFNSARDGAGVSVPSGFDSAITVSGIVRFLSNVASRTGGGISSVGAASRLHVQESVVFASNMAGGRAGTGAVGGGIYMGRSCFLRVYENVSFRLNSAGSGGGVYLDSFAVALLNNQILFEKNSAILLGGGLYCATNTAVTIGDSVRFHGNFLLQATSIGGGGIAAFSNLRILGNVGMY